MSGYAALRANPTYEESCNGTKPQKRLGARKKPV